mmetsp:Transcript_8067/g.33743  ORF Transcript_8067/g.33743 Transcript_8067/m.33743 type:complete len:228 (+) Transcript_8067:2241-2924(+)
MVSRHGPGRPSPAPRHAEDSTRAPTKPPVAFFASASVKDAFVAASAALAQALPSPPLAQCCRKPPPCTAKNLPQPTHVARPLFDRAKARAPETTNSWPSGDARAAATTGFLSSSLSSKDSEEKGSVSSSTSAQTRARRAANASGLSKTEPSASSTLGDSFGVCFLSDKLGCEEKNVFRLSCAIFSAARLVQSCADRAFLEAAAGTSDLATAASSAVSGGALTRRMAS